MDECLKKKPRTRRDEEANTYIKKHKLLELFVSLTEMLVHHQPDNPLAYLKNTVQKIKSARESETPQNVPRLFEKKDVNTLFDMLDYYKQGHITLIQYQEALKSIGAVKFVEYPILTNEVDRELFMTQALEGLTQAAAETYADIRFH